MMREVEHLESRVRALPPEDFAMFRDWFIEYENELWDQQIAADYRAGKFNELINKARLEMAQGKAREL
jgi:hypothetical protein